MACALLHSSPTSGATNLNLSGTYNGTINGAPLAATGTGVADTTGVTNGDITITFTQLPTGFMPLVMGLAYATYTGWKKRSRIRARGISST